MLSRDASGLDASSATAKRWRLLRDAGAELLVIVTSSQKDGWKEEGMSVIGSGGNILTKWWFAYQAALPFASSVDLITAQDPFELGKIAWLLARRAKKPFEVQDHGGFFDGGEVMEPLWFVRKYVARFLSRRANRIRTVSPLSLEELRRLGLGEKTYWLPIAADPRFSSVERAPEKDLIVTVARLVSVKRLFLLLDAFMSLHARRSSARLIFVGDGPQRTELENVIRVCGLENVVTVTGSADPAPFLSRASLFVLLSGHEGWGVASVEAAMAGVPVLMSRTGCGPWLEELGAAKLIDVKEIDAERIARRIEEILDHTASAQRLGGVPTLADIAKQQVAEWGKAI